jgi:hypothetical protein
MRRGVARGACSYFRMLAASAALDQQYFERNRLLRSLRMRDEKTPQFCRKPGVRAALFDSTGVSLYGQKRGQHNLRFRAAGDISIGCLYVYTSGREGLADVAGATTSTSQYPVANRGSAGIPGFQIGDVKTGKTYDVIFDDAAFNAEWADPLMFKSQERAVTVSHPACQPLLLKRSTCPGVANL